MLKQSKDTAIIRSGDEQISVTDVLNGKHDTALKYLSQYAALSAVVYEKNDNAKKLFPDTLKKWSILDLEFDSYRPNKKGKWVKELKVASYYKHEGGITYVTIIFRGTRFKKWRDWYANFNWITRFIPLVHNAYEQTILQIDTYIEAIENHLIEQNIAESTENIKFISAGHSLGGGLAQQAAYASHRIETVYAYDPSPVTGYHSLSKSKRQQNCEGLKIYRIWEHGEVLLYLRHITKTARKLSFSPNINPRIVEVRFNFVEHENAVKEHNMANLASALIQIEKTLEDTAEPFK
ncbi:hypothetical protein JWG39_09210 [Desulforhopalus vacuolatus]|uniref:DUF6792 domain-containing protein n=1 Tax=Desulforhopalus vacuolatus TaxID=40414 RepID=UPI0019625299|nr:DUF6792 domain-containing protein [Desulforhopalus vacuolatus]MBM9519994.1 hypothetical protein [Desulforhopalus vacuolatus]